MRENKIVTLKKLEPPDDSRMIVTLSIGDLRLLIQEQVKAAMKQNGCEEDRLLDVTEAAKMMSVSEDWLYHTAKTLPFARKIGPKMLRFSYHGIIKWIEAKT